MNNNIKAIEIKYENHHDLQALTDILVNNNYKIQVSPVYETEEQIKTRAPRSRYAMKTPRIDRFAVELIGRVEKPVYVKEEVCSECGSVKDTDLF